MTYGWQRIYRNDFIHETTKNEPEASSCKVYELYSLVYKKKGHNKFEKKEQSEEKVIELKGDWMVIEDKLENWVISTCI